MRYSNTDLTTCNTYHVYSVYYTYCIILSLSLSLPAKKYLFLNGSNLNNHFRTISDVKP